MIPLLFTLALLSAHAPTNERPKGNWYQRWKRQRYMTGEWFGARKTLEQKGLVPSLKFTNVVSKTVRGGLKEGRSLPFRLTGGVKLEFEKLLGLTGFSLYVEGIWQGRFNSTSCLSCDYAGSFQTLNDLDNTRDHLSLSQLWIEQRLLGGDLVLRAGHAYGQDIVLQNPSAREFVNTSFHVLPTLPLARYRTMDNHFHAFESSPTRQQLASALGLGLTYRVNSLFTFNAVALDQRPEEDTLFLSKQSRTRKNASVTVEFAFTPKLFGRRGDGVYRLGLWYVNQTDYSDKAEEDIHPHAKKFKGTAGIYLTMDQAIFREREQKVKGQGLYLFLQAGVAPGRWEVMFTYGGGLLYRGPFPKRPRDTTGIAVSIVDFSPKMEGDMEEGQFVRTYGMFSNEAVFEWFYKIQAGNWLSVHHGLQWVRVPKGIRDPADRYYAKDALVFNVRGEFLF